MIEGFWNSMALLGIMAVGAVIVGGILGVAIACLEAFVLNRHYPHHGVPQGPWKKEEKEDEK